MIRFVNFGVLLVPVIALCFVAMAATAQAETIVNGDFEDLTGWGAPGTTEFPAGWTSTRGRKNPASQQSGTNAIGGSGTSAFMASFPSSSDTTRREMLQAFTSVGPDWRVEFDFASEDPGGASDRSLSGGMLFSNGNKIILRVVDFDADGDGDIQLYRDGTYNTVASLKDSVTFDDDASVTPLTHHVSVTGCFDDSPSYDITITRSDSQQFTATGLTYWQFGGEPPVNGGIVDVNFNTFISNGDYVLDNVSVAVPEPCTFALAITGMIVAGLGMISRRRRG